MKRILAAFVFVLLVVVPVAAGNWPNWRGLDKQGHCTETNVPLKWSAKENVRWHIDLPESGNSTPVVWGDRVFVTQAKDKSAWPPKPGNGGAASAETRLLLCLQRSDGKMLWEARVSYKELEATHPTNPFCAASPVTDGERVVVSFGSAGLYCYDMAGKEMWRKDFGKMEHVWGNASSPILHEDLCILWVGPGKNQVLVALNKKTGEEVWRYEEPGGASGLGADKEWIGSWSTPIVISVEGHEELILGVPMKVRGFDPKTGKELWSCSGLSKLIYTSPICSKDGVIVAMSGYTGPALAVRAGGKGDVTKTHRLWVHEKCPQRIGSGVIVGEHVYILNDSGIAQCLEVKTGKEVWSQRLASTWSSLAAVGDRLYVPTKSSETYVFKAAPEFMELARNRLQGEQMHASLAISDGDIFIRTFKGLWCIGDKK